MVLKMKTDYFSPNNNNNPNNNSNNIIIRPISMNIVDGGDVEHVIDVNYLKRGSCEHRDSFLSTITSSCRKVEEEEIEIQQQHNKKQALECECNNISITVKDDDDGNDDDTSTCIDTSTATSTSTSTTTSPRVVVVVPTTKKAKNNNKVVRFTSECENVMYRYPRPTKEEKLDMYMSKDDYERIIMNVVKGIHKKQESNNDDNNNNSEDTDTNNNNDNENELCIECILVQQNSDRIERVKSAISTILKRNRGLRDQEVILSSLSPRKIVMTR
ncbi:hypothetical protein FRACYDRAFT_238710 [Fragilariopsis cylindrus CCMP1102]|uniref:Uncharacterized protein n=1 Tax=Fragilariopsis cylindrus CCMP1102 TaxID=635003 RepID=A0A1E7FDA3_9STRA|nr:hypothetical protein FRACYDRAFT_238710 [Fragilariopsis cylindrus CCMP1102]|eukprot:OEU16124.1 hypothetical protein FRACYDRAFT_238710 [Fragilariopsis cylindrus CCMP1102]